MNEMSEVTLKEVQRRLDQEKSPNELFQQLQQIWNKRHERSMCLPPEQIEEMDRCVAFLQRLLPRRWI